MDNAAASRLIPHLEVGSGLNEVLAEAVRGACEALKADGAALALATLSRMQDRQMNALRNEQRG